MTDEQIAQWKVERDIARSIRDDDERRVALEKVYDHRDEMQMTCIAHQGARQKALVADVAKLKTDIEPLKKDHEELASLKERKKGFVAAFELAKWVVAAGGGAWLMKILGAQ